MSNGNKPVYRTVTAIVSLYVMYNSSTGVLFTDIVSIFWIGSLVDFDYIIRESYDENYGNLDFDIGLWNGMIYELMNNVGHRDGGDMDDSRADDIYQLYRKKNIKFFFSYSFHFITSLNKNTTINGYKKKIYFYVLRVYILSNWWKNYANFWSW